jgi:hypothetical protein
VIVHYERPAAILVARSERQRTGTAEDIARELRKYREFYFPLFAFIRVIRGQKFFSP